MRFEQSRHSAAGWQLRRAAAFATAAISALAFASIALANAPDPGTTPAEFRVGPIVNIDGVDTVRVSVSGAWQWPTHSSDCNGNRTGVGYAVDWDDPNQPGNYVAEVDSLPVDVGAAAANNYNPADNVVHPTRPEVAGNLFIDIADPADYENWRSGCGTYDGSYPKGMWGAVDLITGEPVACTSDTEPSLACQGGSHVYTVAALQEGVMACALLYDVHGGDADQGGVPNGEKEVTAGGDDHNKDNGIEANGITSLDDACADIVPPEPDPTASPTVDPGATPDPSATPVPGVTHDPSGSPDPNGTPDPDSTPDPTDTPGLPETDVTVPGSSSSTRVPALVVGLLALLLGVFAATRRPIRRARPSPAAAAGPWSTTRIDRTQRR